MNILYALELPNWLLPIIIVVAVVLIVLAILLWIFISRRRKKPSARTNDQPARNPGGLESGTSYEAFYLRLVDNQGNTKHIGSLPASIGRSEENQVILKGDTVSATHANIYYNDTLQAICIEDRNSLNGIFVNGRPTCKNILHDGAEITFGSVTLTFRDTGHHPNH